MDLSGLPKPQSFKRTNVFLHKHINVYNLYSNKIEKGLKKDLQLGPKCPSATEDRKTTSQILGTTLQSICWTRSGLDRSGLDPAWSGLRLRSHFKLKGPRGMTDPDIRPMFSCFLYQF